MFRSSATATTPVDLLLDGFVGYLRRERGVTVLTVDAYVSDVRRFLAHRGGNDLGELTAAEVSKGGAGPGGRPVACVGAAIWVRAAFVSALRLSRRAGRDRPVGCRAAGVRAATVVAAARRSIRRK